MWTFLKSKGCLLCAEKDRRLEDLAQHIQSLKSQLAHSREREEKAVDGLLDRKGEASITPSPKFTAKDSESAYKDVFGIFKDEYDDGSGNVVEVDQLTMMKLPQAPTS